jgi:hypothetical protein
MSHSNRLLLIAQYEITFLTAPADWEFRKDEDGPNEAVLEARADFRLERKTFDPWKSRAEFFSIRHTDQLLFFLEKTGLFGRPYDPFANLDEWKILFRLLMKTNPVDWAKLQGEFAPPKLSMVLRSRLTNFKVKWGKPHRITLTATSTLAAIVSSIEIDHLRGAKCAFCQRDDCGLPYPYRTNKKFCNHDCAHLDNVRRRRARDRRNGKKAIRMRRQS